MAGSRGTLEIFNPYAPQHRHHMTVRTAGVRHETSSATFELLGAAGDLREPLYCAGTPYPTDCADAVANMRVVDACYTAAGLRTREPSLT